MVDGCFMIINKSKKHQLSALEAYKYSPINSGS
jgi:hypothetical protein